MKHDINFNENKNKIDVPKTKLEELGILKVLSISIGEDGKAQYRVVTTEGEVKFISASDLIGG